MIYYLTDGVIYMPKGVSNKRYTPEFKKLVIETMPEEKLSYRETARRFEVNDHHRIQDWERINLKKNMQIIPPEKVRDYLKAAEEWGVLPMFYLELSTGLRRGELVALLWSDLNLQTKTLTVSKSASRGKGELVVTEPKTENSVREIYLSDEAIRLLVEDRKNHPFSPYLFPSPKTGGMYGPDCVGRIHKKLLEKAAAKKIGGLLQSVG